MESRANLISVSGRGGIPLEPSAPNTATRVNHPQGSSGGWHMTCSRAVGVVVLWTRTKTRPHRIWPLDFNDENKRTLVDLKLFILCTTELRHVL